MNTVAKSGQEVFSIKEGIDTVYLDKETQTNIPFY